MADNDDAIMKNIRAMESIKNFELSQETKFSIRTLMLLSAFAIGVFLFNINPDFFGYGKLEQPDKRWPFALFVLLTTIVQLYVTWNLYKKDKSRNNIYNYIFYDLKNQINELRDKIKKSGDDNKKIQNYEAQIKYREDFIKTKQLIDNKINGKYIFYLTWISIGISFIAVAKNLLETYKICIV